MQRHPAWPVVLFCNEFTRGALFYTWLPLVVPHQTDVTLQWIGLCTTLQFAADAFTKLCFGFISARLHGTTWVLRGGTFLALLAAIALLFVHQPLGLLVASVAFGIGAASVWPAALANYSDAAESQRGASVAQAFLPWMAGTGAGMLITDFMAHALPLARILIMGAVAIDWIGSFFLHPRIVQKTLSFHREWSIIQVLGRRIRAFLPPMVLQTAVIGTITPFFAPFALYALHLPPERYALFFLGIGAIAFLVLLPFGKISDKLGRLPLLTGAFVLASAGAFGLSGAQHLRAAILPAIAFATAYGAVFPVWNAFFADHVPGWMRDRAVGVLTAVEDAGTAVGPLVGGIAWNWMGAPGPFVVAGSMMGVLAIYFGWWWVEGVSWNKTIATER